MKFGIPISLLLHATLIGSGLFVFKGTPKLPDQQKIFPIDIVSISEETNIRATVKRPKPELEPEIEIPTTQDPAPIEPEPQAVVKEEVVESENSPEPTPPEPEPPEPSPPEPTPTETASSPDTTEVEVKDVAEDVVVEEEVPAFSLDNLSALIDRSREDEPSANQQKILQSEETLYAFADVTRQGAGAGDGLSLSETDALRAAMYKCWRIPADAKDPESLIVPVEVKLHRDGYVASASLKNGAAVNNSSNPYMKIAAENALRAISKCAPYDFLPAERYDSWKQMTLTFRPVLSQ